MNVEYRIFPIKSAISFITAAQSINQSINVLSIGFEFGQVPCWFKPLRRTIRALDYYEVQ